MLLILIWANFYIFKGFNVVLWSGWISLDWKVSILQLSLLFFFVRLFFIQNNYQVVGYSLLFILGISVYLFYMQLDVFACFLLISETIVLLFVLTMLIHLNSNNLKTSLRARNLALVWLGVIVILLNNTWLVNYYNYYVEWYLSQYNGYNDLVSQYIYFFESKYILVLIALWLLILTMLLVSIVISCYSAQLNNTKVEINTVMYSRKSESLWHQWFTKPINRFFN